MASYGKEVETIMNKAAQLANKIRNRQFVVAPGAHDAITAKIIEDVGYECIFISGHGISTAALGKPDLSLITLTEMVVNTKYIVEAVEKPVLVDGDTGYGGLLNVRRAVQELEQAGACGIQLEDQVFPKRCGYVDGGGLVSAEEMCRRLYTAAEARKDQDFLIIARTDMRLCNGLDEALERASQYSKAGADLLFINGLSTKEQARQCSETVNLPLVYNFSGTGIDPLNRLQDIKDYGFTLAILPTYPLRAAVKSVSRLLESVRCSGELPLEPILGFEEWKNLTGTSEMIELDQKLNNR
jgi:2-methylisocitrate lyase-like PEP mutase family enzyme